MMVDIKQQVYVKVEYYTGEEESQDDVGHPYYVASSEDLHFVTQGDNFEELLDNIHECLVLALQDGDSIAENGVSPNARVTLMMEMPGKYAQQTA